VYSYIKGTVQGRLSNASGYFVFNIRNGSVNLKICEEYLQKLYESHRFTDLIKMFQISLAAELRPICRMNHPSILLAAELRYLCREFIWEKTSSSGGAEYIG